MSEPELNALLLQLHDKLNESPDIDDESRRLLGIVSQDVAVTMGRSRTTADDKTTVAGSMTLKKMAVEFEAEHPRLAHTLNDVADSLAKIGI